MSDISGGTGAGRLASFLPKSTGQHLCVLGLLGRGNNGARHIVTAISGAPPEKWEAESYTKEALPSRQHRKSKNKPRRPRPFRLSSIKNENSPNSTSAAEICVDWGRAARAACAARDPACACSLRWWRARSLRRSPTRGAATRTREHRLCVFFFHKYNPSQPSQERTHPTH